MELVERREQLAELAGAVRDAGAGRGSLVLVTGEAGAGKTALLRRFAAAGGSGRILWGMCDELATPRPLGPLRDMARQLDGEPPSNPAPASADNALDAVAAALAAPPRPAVALIEDAHWADEATLDAIRFLGRRVGRMPALLVVTFRDDEVPADHPLRRTIGAVPPDDLRRIRLPPLSRAGVARLAGHDDVTELYRLTGGNPFYVTEVLAGAGQGGSDTAVPPTVADAVMARVGRLGEGGRECVATAAVVPGGVERWVLDASGIAAGGIDEAVRLGVLHADGTALLRFSHELARRAVEHSLPPARRQDLNRRLLDVLATAGGEVDPARLAHLAGQAGDAAAVARYAPVAARRAVALSSHREAAAHFRQALDRPELFPAPQLGSLWYEYAEACYTVGRHEPAEAALRRAIEIHTAAGDRGRVGGARCLLSDVLWFLGRGEEATRAAAEAIAILRQQPAPADPAARATLARAYAQHAKLAMVDHRGEEAIESGERAIALARETGATSVLVHALNTVGMVRWRMPERDNRAVHESLRLARAHGLPGQATRAYANLVAGHLHRLEYGDAERLLADGLAFCEAHDQVATYLWLLSHRAQLHLERGRWAEAEADARGVLAAGEVGQIVATKVLGLVQARQGDDAAGATLAQAQRLADRSGDAQNLLGVGLARLELAWLRGNLAAGPAATLVDEMVALARDSGSDGWKGEAALWAHRAGAPQPQPLPPEVPEPYARQIAGDWQGAAAQWEQVGHEYQRADALADAPEPEPLLAALEILYRLGARPRAAMVRRRLSELGVTRIPRGPRAAARASVAGLTARQTEVLHLLADGLTYQEIARRLRLSTKTVDHHVTAIRRALGVTNRDEAVDAGRRLGIVG